MAFSSQAKGEADGEPPFDEPPQWTWGAVQEGLAEVSKAAGKSVEKILLCVCKQAAEQRQETLEALEQGVPQLERCLVHTRHAVDSRVPFQGVGPLSEAVESLRPGAGCEAWAQCCSTGSSLPERRERRCSRLSLRLPLDQGQLPNPMYRAM